MKLEIIDEKYLIINTHKESIHLRNVKRTKPTRTSNKGKYMTTKNYIKLIHRFCDKLWHYKIDFKNCQFITLTFNSDISYDLAEQKIKNFIRKIERQFGKIKYIKSIEIQKKSKRFHFHIIIIFANDKLLITDEWTKRKWKDGFVYIDTKTNIYDIKGLIEYLTNFKDGSIQTDNKDLTYFPKGAKIISCSKDIEKVDAEVYNINKSDLIMILSHFHNQEQISKKHLMRINKHIYTYNNIKYVNIDKVYIKADKNFVDNILGVKKDDRILKEKSEK